ncbi:carbonic anhydrase [Fundicoccus culcitae]|uniref:Carbonic anhydrase n=1 Tax=Fundicoccus culcitae TaxID=2969821 RepID=A0ABY5P793_9LACT|nr:carbonic anhydrase [Fundicoccus culcitae]UUX34465.1 hypothetical protein NRE15_02105 [Fundicoccus culcitae]
MQDLYQALRLFKEDDYRTNHDLYESLSESQTPHSLFISCSDSRVSPERLLRAYPGEIFQIRNIANIVPHSSQSNDNTATTSAIEYALEVLAVENIIVCGHSNCGGCAAAINPSFDAGKLPFTGAWISQLHELSDYVNEIHAEASIEFKSRKLEKLNVIKQIDNLMSYVNIRKKVEEGVLKINGWHYNIGLGEISIYNELIQDFMVI